MEYEIEKERMLLFESLFIFRSTFSIYKIKKKKKKMIMG